MERLQKIIADSGYCSRRKAEELIKEGKVAVNGIIVTELGFKASGNDSISVCGETLKKEEKVVYLLNKPKNVISSCQDDKGRITVIDLIDTNYRIFPLGRLDYDSSGLLLLSNDGDLMQALIHPRFEVKKTYEVTIDGLINDKDIERLIKGVRIEDYTTAPCEIELLKINKNKYTSFMNVIIHEGRNREIRKMFDKVGYKVVKLHRIKEANIELGNLRPGEYRRLKPFEVKQLKAYLNSVNN